MSEDKNVFLIVGVLALVIFLVFSFQQLNSTETKNYPLVTQFSENDQGNVTLGIAQEENYVDFGVLPLGTISARKEIKVSNNGRSDVKVKVTAYGNITKYLTIEQSSFELGPQETRNIDLLLEGENVTETTYLEGRIEISKKKAWW